MDLFRAPTSGSVCILYLDIGNLWLVDYLSKYWLNGIKFLHTRLYVHSWLEAILIP